MKILDFFRSAPTPSVPTYTQSEVVTYANIFITELQGIKNTAVTLGPDVSKNYKETERYAGKVIKNAWEKDVSKTMDNAIKLTDHSNALFFKTCSQSTENAIVNAESALYTLRQRIIENGFSLE